MGIIRDKGPEGFARDAKPRALTEILDAADLYYPIALGGHRASPQRREA
jgi:hypothetical protein